MSRSSRAARERDAPDRCTTALAKKAPGSKIFLDCLRNDRPATAIGNFSPRARPGAQVAHPLAWAAMKPGLDPKMYRLSDLAAEPLPRDLWGDFGDAARSLVDAVCCLTRGGAKGSGGD